MTEEQREYAFTGMLSSTKDKGGGLGLAIVAKVAEAHGGRVEVESAPARDTDHPAATCANKKAARRPLEFGAWENLDVLVDEVFQVFLATALVV